MVQSDPKIGREGAPRDAGLEASGQGAEEFFRAGVILLRRKQVKDAQRAFQRALDLAPSEPRYGSYFGLCLAASGTNVKKGLQLCEKAAEAEFYRPDLHLNLGKACVAAGLPGKAQQALRVGLSLDPQNKEIVRELDKLGVRRRPFFPFLDRKNPLNKWVGLVRHRLAPSPSSLTFA